MLMRMQFSLEFSHQLLQFMVLIQFLFHFAVLLSQLHNFVVFLLQLIRYVIFQFHIFQFNALILICRGNDFSLQILNVRLYVVNGRCEIEVSAAKIIYCHYFTALWASVCWAENELVRIYFTALPQSIHIFLITNNTFPKAISIYNIHGICDRTVCC